MKPSTFYQLSGFISVDDLRPKAATKIAMSEILAARIRMLTRVNARKARAKAAEEMDR